MPRDALGILTAVGTQTATFTSTALDLKTGTPRRGIKVQVIAPAGTGTSPTLDVKVQESADNTTFNDLVNWDRATTADYYQVETVETQKRYIRALGTIGGTLPVFAGLRIDVVSGKP